MTTMVTAKSLGIHSGALVDSSFETLGKIKALRGGRVVVYKYKAPDSSLWAIRIPHDVAAWPPDLVQRFQRYQKEANQHFEKVFPNNSCPEVLRQEIVGTTDKGMPVMKMPWIEGPTIGRYIYNHLNQPQKLTELRENFLALIEKLRRGQYIHRDLSEKNIRILPNGAFRLLDQDSVAVPSFFGEKAIETGNVEFQHPHRGNEIVYAKDGDYFSSIVVYLTIYLLEKIPALHAMFDEDDLTLFSRRDYLTPDNALVFKTILASTTDATTKNMVERFMQICKSPSILCPSLAEFLEGRVERGLDLDIFIPADNSPKIQTSSEVDWFKQFVQTYSQPQKPQVPKTDWFQVFREQYS